jgi:hypothetical protein
MKTLIKFTSSVLIWGTSSVFAQTNALIDRPGFCVPSENKGCTRTWSVKEKSCVLECEAIPFTGLPIVVGRPIPQPSTGPATPGVNLMEPEQLRAIIRGGTPQQRAQVADWLATPTINLALDPAARPIAPDLLSPELREILKTIRQGTERERNLAAERLFKVSK